MRKSTAKTETVHVVAAPEEERESMWDNETVKNLAPLVGAGAGTVAVTYATEKLALPRRQVAFSGAALAYVAGTHASGSLKRALMGAAAAGVCIGLVDLLEERRPTWIYGDQPAPTAQRPDDAVETHDRAYMTELRKLADANRKLLEQLRAVQAELAHLRNSARAA